MDGGARMIPFFQEINPVNMATLGLDSFSRACEGARRLKDVVEGKLLDALHAVALGMTMDELHEKRTRFVQEVRDLVAPDLLNKSLELHSVSLTSVKDKKSGKGG